MRKKAPLSDEIVIAVSRLVDDAKQTTREPSHADLSFQISRFKLEGYDPKTNGQSVGKAKRIRAVLSEAIETDLDAGEKLVASVISLIKTIGGFTKTSPNYVGSQAILNAQGAFKTEGYELTNEGDLHPLILGNLSDLEMNEALRAYIRRAKKGSEDAALVAGTGKDLLEAVAGFVLTKKYGTYSHTANFPTLLGQAFHALNLETPNNKKDEKKTMTQEFEKNLYLMGCSINKLRNKEGTGHGRPFPTTLSKMQATAAIETMGVIAELLLNSLNE